MSRFLFAVGLVAIASRASAQPSGTVVDSYLRARTLLDAAVTAHGGVAALRAATRFGVVMEGQDLWRNQSRKVAPPYDPEPYTGDLRIDLPRTRFVWTNTSRFPGGFQNAGRTVIDGSTSYAANLRQGTHLVGGSRPIESQRGILNRLPHLVLLQALENAPGLRWLGPMTLASGARVEVIATAAGPAQLTLGIDPSTRTLRALLGVQADPIAGDAATEAEFTDYWRVAGILVPGRRVARVAGEVTQEVRYRDATTDPVFPDSILGPPAGSVAITPPASGEPVRELAPGVWAVNSSGYWCLVVSFADHVLVMEAPGFGVPDLMARVRTLAPGKPIRYVVPTHHHDDHAGGMRHYIGAGTTVVTTPGNREYFERMGRAHSTLRPDSQSVARLPARIELIANRKRVMSDGSRTVELIDIGPSPHAEEMVVAWLPQEGILFQGDLLNLPPDGKVYPTSANLTTVHFAAWVKRQGWTVRVLAGVHMAPGTIGQLEEAVAIRRP